MTSTTRMGLVGVFLAAGVAAGLGLGRAFDARSEIWSPAPLVRPEPPAALVNLQESFTAAAEFAMQSVVHITTQVGRETDLFQGQGVGSGVIASAEGHIITNNHVVDAGGERLRALLVRFADGREIAAKVVGRDSDSDLALLKIDVPRGTKLMPATFADSDKVRVGELCLAIGSPFGYNHTVTHGIVSAKHRRANLNTPYQDFIQTDAAINPGNSGGALVNIRGELIGINTAIVSETRTSDGVGLAISSNLVRWVKDWLAKDGRVRRGYLGIRPHDFDQELVTYLKQDGIRTVEDLLDDVGLKEPRGVFIFLVEPDSPAAKAGLKDHDVLLEFNGKAVSSQSDMFFRVAEVSPGTQVTVKVLRDKKERELKVELAERPPLDPRRPRKR